VNAKKIGWNTQINIRFPRKEQLRKRYWIKGNSETRQSQSSAESIKQNTPVGENGIYQERSWKWEIWYIQRQSYPGVYDDPHLFIRTIWKWMIQYSRYTTNQESEDEVKKIAFEKVCQVKIYQLFLQEP